MKQTYIATIPMHPAPEQMRYSPAAQAENTPAQDTIVTSFPIVQVIHNTLQAGDEFSVIAILMENDDTRKAYDVFLDQLAQTVDGFTPSMVRKVVVPENQSTNNLLGLLRGLIDAIPDTTRLHACTTYGTKPVSNVILSALTCAENLKQSLEIGGIYYGEVKRVNKKPQYTADGIGIATLYESTSLYRLTGIVSQIDNLQAANALFDSLLRVGMQQEGKV